VPVSAATPHRALAVGAHPDDVEFGAGTTLAQWSDAGCAVHLLVLTDGSKGTWDVHEDLAALVATRQREARAAASVLARATVSFGGFVDGELDARDAAPVVCRLIREVRPDVVLGHDPWKRYRLHPDHRHAGFATVDGLVAARDPHFLPGLGGAHHRPDVLMLFEADEPDHDVPAEAGLERQVAALLCHESQWRSTMRIDPTAPDRAGELAAFADRVRARHPSVDGSAVEQFRRITGV
jgi:LmbE family N-acetylglucosaminyl deacetylase